MKRFFVRLGLVITFVLLMGVIAFPFVSEIQLKHAGELESDYRWKRAEEVYQSVLCLDPLNAEHFFEAGNFFMRQGTYRKEKSLWIEKARKMYERGAQLNSKHAENWYSLGRIEIGKKEFNSGVKKFRETIRNDPFNFRLNYFIGYNLLLAWDFLNAEDKEFALERLKYVIHTKRGYLAYIYPDVMRYTSDFDNILRITPETLAAYKSLYSYIRKNELWQFRKSVVKRMDGIKEKEQFDVFHEDERKKENTIKELKRIAGNGGLQTWCGTSEDGKRKYRNGKMYWAGTLNIAIKLPRGKACIKIGAKGAPAFDAWPYMIVNLELEEIGETFVDNPEWKEYIFEVETEGGIKILSVTYMNNAYDIKKDKKRNLFIGGVQIESANEQ